MDVQEKSSVMERMDRRRKPTGTYRQMSRHGRNVSNLMLAEFQIDLINTKIFPLIIRGSDSEPIDIVRAMFTFVLACTHEVHARAMKAVRLRDRRTNDRSSAHE